MQIKDDVLFVRATPAFKKKVKDVAGTLETDMSRFVREAVTEKMKRLSRNNPKVAEILNQQAA